MVCWSVIAMLKEYIFLVIVLSALATLAALKIYDKCCLNKNQKDLESNQQENKLEGLGKQSGAEGEEEEQLDYEPKPESPPL